MKRLFALIFVVMTLTACGKKNTALDNALSFRKSLLSAKGCSFDTTITADYGDVVYNFKVRCQSDEKNELAFTVLQPETIAGITGTIDQDGGNITFDNKALFFNTMADGQISPISAPWLMLRTLKSGYIKGAGNSTNGEFIQIYDSYEEDALLLNYWLHENNVPNFAEIFWQGRRVVSIKIENFEIL